MDQIFEKYVTSALNNISEYIKANNASTFAMQTRILELEEQVAELSNPEIEDEGTLG